METFSDSVGQFALLSGDLAASGHSKQPWIADHVNQHAAIDYLSVHDPGHQSFCRNREGWGPLSPYRFDFTPCFTDVWLVLVATFGISAGAAAIWYLRKYAPQPVKKDWHFWTKMVSTGRGFSSPSDEQITVYPCHAHGHHCRSGSTSSPGFPCIYSRRFSVLGHNL